MLIHSVTLFLTTGLLQKSEPLFLRACSEIPHGAVCWQSMLRVSVNLLNNNRWKERLWKWLIVSFHMLPILGFVLLVQTERPMFLHSSLSFLIISFCLSLLSLCSLFLVIICFSAPSWAREQLNYSTYLVKSIFTLNCNLVTVNEHLVICRFVLRGKWKYSAVYSHILHQGKVHQRIKMTSKSFITKTCDKTAF